jgi:myo-inositol-1(or 4)-monophosphatase
MNLQNEADFFHYIAAEVRKLVNSYEGKASVARYKDTVGDYATEVDIAVENLIVAEIQKRFPGDMVLAEEGHSDVVVHDSRIWIVDPICGTTNLGRGLKTFCTNIALANNNKLIASCVIDHSQNDYFWSVGSSEVYVNGNRFERAEAPVNFGIVIDVDFAALGNVAEDKKKKHIIAVFNLLLEPGYTVQSPSSSLGFAYTAVGKIDGFINPYNHPWDICAASFLITQAGGVITELDGSPWRISSVGAIGATSSTIHGKLLAAYSKTSLIR